MKLKFPSGKVGYEIRYYMGVDHLSERPKIVQDMITNGKCVPGEISDYTKEEVLQLAKEVDKALDIKSGHVDNSRDNRYNWTSLHQYHLQQFYKKLKQ